MFVSRMFAAAVLALLATPAVSEPLLSPVFQDHAVLQRDKPIRLWGTATPGATVTATVNSRSATATADAAGQWRAELPALAAGGPYTVTVASSTGVTQTLSDVLVGDVYLCSGQSNMAYTVANAIDSSPDIQVSANDAIRLMSIATVVKPEPQRVPANPIAWAAAGPKTVPTFSAACYFFGRALQKSVHVPIGLISAPWSGANITAFMSADALHRAGGRDEHLAALKTYHRDPAAAMRQWGGIVEAFWRAHKRALWETPAASNHWFEAPKGLGIWTEWGIAPYDAYTGGMWYRTSIKLTAAQAVQGDALMLGAITTEDQAWVNGHFVGATNGYGNDRLYKLAPGVLHEGDNDILVNDYCTWRGCGLSGPALSRAIRLADGSLVPLGGTWRIAKEPLTPPRVPWATTSGLAGAYNGMIAPLTPYGLRGVLWYQGESNADDADAYRGLLRTWMADWRGAFETPDLPFLIVQLPDWGVPPFAPEERSNWSVIREAQRLAVADDPHAALTVTIDIGDHMGLHPANKQEVGRRLSLAARRLIYGQTNLKAGPYPAAAVRKGNVVTVTFAGVNGKLAAVNASQPIGFELCGNRCAFVGATVAGNAVRLAVPKGLTPTRVRYCWGDGPVCTLYDTTRIPAVPFAMAVGH